MGIKQYKPTTPASRYKSTLTFDEITSSRAYKKATFGLTKKSGRGAGGRVCVRRRGGGHKRKYRIIDFKRDKFNVEGTVNTIEYDPNRSANIALVTYADGEKRYILAPEGLKVGTKIMSGDKAKIETGNCLALNKIPLGTMVHNIELHKGKGGQLARSAGVFAQIVAKEKKFCSLKMPSGEMRLVFNECMATIGQLGNSDHINISIGKAGRSRYLGKRPKVRGVAMNPVDHPHGGGEGRTSGGRHPVSPWGTPTKGYKTRKKKKYSNVLIIKGRKK